MTDDQKALVTKTEGMEMMLYVYKQETPKQWYNVASIIDNVYPHKWLIVC